MKTRDEILLLARRICWRLKGEGVSVNATAAAAITRGRHGPEGRDFAAGILEQLRAGVDLDRAIERALTGKVPS